MKRFLVLLAVLAACGGVPKPVPNTDTTTTARTQDATGSTTAVAPPPPSAIAISRRADSMAVGDTMTVAGQCMSSTGTVLGSTVYFSNKRPADTLNLKLTALATASSTRMTARKVSVDTVLAVCWASGNKNGFQAIVPVRVVSLSTVSGAGGTWDSAQSPHADWISIMYTDFSNRLGSIQAWGAGNLDYSMASGPSKSLNPTFRVYPYTLEHVSLVDSTPDSFSLTSKFGADVKLWAAANGVNPESIWIHDTVPADSAHRRREFTWGSWKWCVNPKAALNYQLNRYQRIMVGVDGAFMDSWDQGSMQNCGKPSHEFATTAAYDTAQLVELRTLRTAIAPRLLMPNLSSYITTPFGYEAAKAAGATHLEKLDNPFNSNLQANWHAIDSLMHLGVFAEYVAAYSYTELVKIAKVFPTYTAGNYHSTVDRGQIAELAAYYMVVPQVPWMHLALDEQNLWDVRPDTVFPAAYKVNVGHPAEARRVYLSGTDATGRTYQVYGRQFTHALVLLRVAQGYTAQDFSWPETVILAKPGRLLHRDGTLDPPISSIQLRVGEGAILIQ